MTPLLTRTSAEETIERFDSAEAAAKYSSALNNTQTHRREMRCILSALRSLPRGSRILDLPCGTGRLLPELAERQWQIMESDSSPHMIEQARHYAQKSRVPSDQATFEVASVFETGFADQSFDAVVCNRLFHHFREAYVRRNALVELKRICRGPIVASFFCSETIDGVMFHLKQLMRKEKAVDRIPISRAAFAADAHACGLSVRRWLSIRPGVSKQCYAVLQRE